MIIDLVSDQKVNYRKKQTPRLGPGVLRKSSTQKIQRLNPVGELKKIKKYWKHENFSYRSI